VRHTAQDSDGLVRDGDAPVPGVVVVWAGDRPALRPFRLPPAGLALGRELLGDTDDDRISRLHARIRAGARGFTVTDLGSRNGTFVDGHPLMDGEVAAAAGAVIRCGRTLALLVDDVRGFEPGEVLDDGEVVAGPRLVAAWREAERAARTGDTLLITGESGAGKELAARAFHRAAVAAGAIGPLVAVNCAAIPANLAERLLFGARRGAYSGADRDADGYLATADGGTLFLDEIAELDLGVQAKLLRVLETGEVLPLGASRATPVRFKVVAATLRPLRDEVAARRFRDDLYYRIGRPEVAVPPLRARREEIPWLVARALAAAPGVTAHPTLVEACLLRPWPGNVRELLGEVRRAALAAREDGRPLLRGEDLPDGAGAAITPAAAIGGAGAASSDPLAATRDLEPEGRRAAPPAPLPDLDAVKAALAAHAGNVSAAARALGIHRNQLRRLLTRHPELDAADDDG
jgi:transcriptional regulator with PAS, ATPase and Fis domain